MPGVNVTSSGYWPRPAAPTPAPAVMSIAGLSGEITAQQLLAALGGAPGGAATPDAVTSTTIRTIVALTQAEYDALGAEAPATLYVITG